MGPPRTRRLALWRSPGKAMGKMTDVEGSHTPPGRNRRKGLENEAPARQARVRNRQPPGAEFAAGPQHDVEIEHPRAPAPPQPSAELALQAFETRKHVQRLELAFHQGNAVGEVP